MSETLRDFLVAAQCQDWDAAFTLFNGLNMTEMLKGLAALPPPIAEEFRQQSPSRTGVSIRVGGVRVFGQARDPASGAPLAPAVDGPRIAYAFAVFFGRRLPLTAPGDLTDTGQVQEAWKFLQGQPVNETSNLPMGDITVEQLRLVMPNLGQSLAVAYLPALNAAMSGAEINTRLRRAAFLAQLAEESVELRYMQEIASGDEYEGRTDLGNTQPGDGRRYKGRGPIQLTGRSNYRAAGAALGLNLEGDPDQGATPEVGFRTSGWFWTTRHLNPLADAGNFREITHRVNGGFNGMPARLMYYHRALHAF
jgi:predicted chitinase